MSRVVAAYLVTLAGCDQVFQLDRHEVDAAIPGLRVTGHHGVRVIEPDGLGGYLAPRPLALAADAWVELDDGTQPEITVAEDLAFSFARDRVDQTYRLRYRTAGTTDVPTTIDSSASELFLISPLFGRYERDPVTPGTTLGVALGEQTMKQTYLFTTGLRAFRLVNETPMPLAGFALDWTLMTSLSGPLGLPKAARFDTLYLASYEVISGAGYYAIDGIGSVPVTLAAGMATNVQIDTQRPALGRCVRLTAQRFAEQNRVLGTVTGTRIPRTEWAVSATPNPIESHLGGILLAYQDSDAGADTTVDVRYANPFLGERQIVRVTASLEFDVEPGTTVRIDTHHWAPLPVTTTCDAASAVTLGGSVALATAIAIDGQPARGPIALTDRRVTFEASAGVADYFVVEVLELASRTVVTRNIVRTPSATLDPDLLHPGTAYVLRVASHVGNPAGADGDFRQITYPVGESIVYSRAFTVN